MEKSPNNIRYYCLSFIEGGSVMACELIGAKLLAPYFGSSLYVWASVLAVTLGGLMTGYFLGGRLSLKSNKNESFLFWILSGAGFLLILMPILGKWIMSITLTLPVQWASVLSLMVFMFPALILMGMASPLFINILTDKAKKAGGYAGNIYAISTFGGILFTFAMGFYLIPVLGISLPSLICGGLLIISSGLLLRTPFKIKLYMAMFLLISSMGFFYSFTQKSGFEGSIVQYQSEGLLGQIKVLDLPAEDSSGQQTYRGLFINNTLQTIINLDKPENVFFSHIENIPYLLSKNKSPGKALLLGMGGGNLANKIANLGWQVDAVDIDARLEKIAKDFFNLSPDINVIIDDARHVINTSNKKYDLILFDLFYGELMAEHVITGEAFNNCKAILNDNGILLFNFFSEGEKIGDLFGQSILKTLHENDFSIEILLPILESDDNNILIVAGKNSNPINDKCSTYLKQVNWTEKDFENAIRLSDNYQYPGISLNLTKDWRDWYNEVIPTILNSAAEN